jgi:hypothetical protein
MNPWERDLQRSLDGKRHTLRDVLFALAFFVVVLVLILGVGL